METTPSSSEVNSVAPSTGMTGRREGSPGRAWSTTAASMIASSVRGDSVRDQEPVPSSGPVGSSRDDVFMRRPFPDP